MLILYYLIFLRYILYNNKYRCVTIQILLQLDSKQIILFLFRIFKVIQYRVGIIFIKIYKWDSKNERILTLKNISRSIMTELQNDNPLPQTSELIFMRSKYPALKQKSNQPFPYFYQPIPQDQQIYSQKFSQFKNKLKQTTQFSQEFTMFYGVALGKIQGMPGALTPWEQLSKLLQFPNKEFWTQFLKQKLTQKWCGLPKQKSYSIWQIRDIEVLKQFFNIEEIKKQRKTIRQFSTFYKALNKFIEKFQKLSNQQQITQAYQQYKKVQQQETKMNKILSQKNKEPKTSTLKIKQIKLQNSQNSNQKVQAMKQQNQQMKAQNIQIQVNKIDTPLAQESINKIIKTEDKQIINQMKPQIQQEQLSKIDIKSTRKKTQSKQQNSNKKQNKLTNQKQQQLLSKYKSLDSFFKKKQPQPKQIKKQMQEELNFDKPNPIDVFLSMLGCNKQNDKSDLEYLKTQFSKTKKTLDQEIKTCYSTIIMARSRLQLTDFPIKQIKANFINPFSEYQTIRYDDSSDQYSELVADSINEEMIQQEEESQEQFQQNSAIVEDVYCQYKSSYVMSSSDSSDSQQIDKPQMIKSVGRWSFFNIKDNEKKEKYFKYQMICLIEQPYPLIVKQVVEQSNNQVTSVQKVQMYRQIHGSYTPKDVLIKKLNSIVENKISMNKLSTLIKDICEKKGNQRVIKTQIIRQMAQDLSEQNPNIEAEFQQLRCERQAAKNQQNQAKRQQKMNERDQKIQKLILEYQGPFSTKQILQYLKSHQIKLVKQQLNEIIKVKQGQKWDHIRNQIKKSKLIKGLPKPQKKQKKKKQQKMKQQQEHLKHSHIPIDEMIKQNQLQMLNKPKKQKKVVEQEMVEQAQDQMIAQPEEAQIEPEDDQSFSLNNKRGNKKGNKSKNKKIVKIGLLPMARINPKRNRRKTKKYLQMQQNKKNIQQIGQNNQNQMDVQQKLEDEQQNKDKIQIQQNSQKIVNKYEGYKNENQERKLNQNCHNMTDQRKNNSEVEINSSKFNKSEQFKKYQPAVSPIKYSKQEQIKNGQQIYESTANKSRQGQNLQSEV